MTAPLFLLPAGALDGVRPGEEVLVDGAEGRHAVAVRRLVPGEPADVADGVGRLVRGEVTRAERDALTVRALAVEEVPEPAPRFVLVQALAKGGRDEQAVETCTELGVDEVLPWAAERSVVQWRGERGEKARRGWAEVARAATKQSRRPRLPEVGRAVDLRDLLRRVETCALAVVLHEQAADPLTRLPVPASGDVLLVVGPEGGISERELEQLRAAGARTARLGAHVLRSSTAGAAALAVLSAACGRW
ncbi:MAG: 16S rRNA (uracil(1498)-N(3))-methyltransferase [Kineosporiaceae bacterium]